MVRLADFFLLVFLCAVFFFAGGCEAARAEAGKDYMGERIAYVRVAGLRTMDREELLLLLDIRPGDTLSREGLRRGLERVFRKGIFHDLRVDAVEEPAYDGLVLAVTVYEKERINGVRIEGNDNIGRDEIEKVVGVHRGMEYMDDLSTDVRGRVREDLARRGYPEAEVAVGPIPSGRTGLVDLLVTVAEGRSQRIRAIEVSGVGDLTRARFLMRLKEGDRMDSIVLEEDLENIRADMRKRGYFEAASPTWGFSDGLLSIHIAAGPRYEIRFEGNGAIPSQLLRAEYRFEETGVGVGDASLEEAALRFVSYYHKQGYPHAQAAVSVEGEADRKILLFHIHEGARFRLREVRFQGVSLSLDRIREVMEYPDGELYDEVRIEESLGRVIALYNALGYLSAIVSEVRTDLESHPFESVVDVAIEEGPQTRLGWIRFLGHTVLGDDEIVELAGLAPGIPYNEIDVADARYRILDAYARRGYIHASVQVVRTPMAGMRTMDVDFVVEEGRLVRFGKTIVAGNTRTSDTLIRRELGIREGDPYDQRRILEGKRALHRTGLFSSVQVEEPHPFADGEVRDVLVEVREGSFGSVDLGVGYGDYERVRGFFEIGHRNLGGLNRRISLRGEWSSVERRHTLSYADPWLFLEYRMPFRMAVVSEYQRRLDPESRDVRFESQRLSYLMGVDRSFTDILKGSLTYEYSIVDTYNVREGEILGTEDTGTLGISSITPSIARDTRNNPFNPRQGSLNATAVKWASRAFLSETDFVKATAQSSWYIPLARPLVGAISLKGGLAHGMGESSELPLVERFFLGGADSVRGFGRDSLGPQSPVVSGVSVPTGGNSFLLVNNELRLDVWKSLGVVGFLDGGNVWVEATDTDPLDLRYAWGFGLRYNTPVGPFRADYGKKIEPKPGESTFEIHISLGHAF